MKLRTFMKTMYTDNDGTRTLLESIIVPEIHQAIKKWIKSSASGVLIGGLALSYYIRPRYTMDIDILFLTDHDIPDQLPGFKRIREHSFQHNKTHVEVEVLSARFLNLPPEMVQQIIKSANTIDGMRVADKAGLIVLKLKRGNRQDQADIEHLIKSGGVDIAPYLKWLTQSQIQLYMDIKQGLSQ